MCNVLQYTVRMDFAMFHAFAAKVREEIYRTLTRLCLPLRQWIIFMLLLNSFTIQTLSLTYTEMLKMLKLILV